MRRFDYEIAGVWENDMLVGPNWKEAIQKGDLNVKFLDFIFTLDRTGNRRAIRKLKTPVLNDNKELLAATEPTKR